MFKKLIPAALLLSVLSLPAMAEMNGMKGPGGNKYFEKMDTDKNGEITESEFMAVHKQRFDEMDANKDGKITKDEGKVASDKFFEKMKQRREERMNKMKELKEKAESKTTEEKK